MYQIRTASGTVYEVRNGRITREGDTPVLGRDGFPDDRAAVIVNEPFVVLAPPTVGRSFQFRIKRTGGIITTTRVRSVELYCHTHDLFGCWLCRPVNSLRDTHEDEIQDALAGHP